MNEILLWLCLTVAQDGVNSNGYERIQHGMTKQEVIRILGRQSLGKRPPDLVGGFTLTSLEVASEGEVWKSGTVRIWVVFNEEGRVTAKMIRGPKGRPKE